MITKIALTNYRNLNLVSQLDAHANLIIAPNGSGKSNFLESIYIISSGKSFRPVGTYQELIGPNEEFAKVEITANQAKLQFVISQTTRLIRKYFVNDKVRPQSKMRGLLPVVIFAPHSVDIVAGEPAIRRNDLDNFLAMIYPNYQGQLKRYEKLVKNRNALLKNIREGYSQPDELHYWTNEILAACVPIITARFDFLDKIKTNVAKSAREIYHNDFDSLTCHYLSKHGDTVESYLQHIRGRFAERQNVEIASGQTLYGPHKDDYELVVDGKSLKYFGSRGQQRIAVFIWKYAQILRLQESYPDTKVLFLIDDLLSELDASHKKLISEFLLQKTDLQFIITSADKRDVPQSLQVQNTITLRQ